MNNVKNDNPSQQYLDVVFVNSFGIFEEHGKQIHNNATERKEQIKQFNVFQTIRIQLGSTITSIQTH